MTRVYTKFDLEEFKKVVAESASFAEVARKFGRKPVGGTLSTISHQCKRHNIDTSHMTGQGHNKGKTPNHKKTADQVLVMGTNLDFRSKPAVLRRALAEIGVEYKCNGCGIFEWLRKSLTLEVDHIDGQYWNNTRENLQFLCPNCHSQKPV